MRWSRLRVQVCSGGGAGMWQARQQGGSGRGFMCAYGSGGRSSRAQTMRSPSLVVSVPQLSGPVRASMMSSPWGRSSAGLQCHSPPRSSQRGQHESSSVSASPHVPQCEATGAAMSRHRRLRGPVVFAPSPVIGAARTAVLGDFPGHWCGRNCRLFGEAGVGVWGRTWNRAVVLRGRGVPGFPQCVSGLVLPVVCLLV